MKKNVLALSIAAMIGGFAGAASAQVALTGATATQLVQSEGGTGHILVVPYFTSQNDNMSVFHVVNTDTVNGKALKVRFRGAANSDDILDFTVFLSPQDVWTGAVQANANGSYFYTADGSCTIPDIRKQQIDFVKDRLSTGWTADKQRSNTMEGYLEVLNMADVRSGSDLFTTTKHKSGVAPCDTAVLERTLALTGGDATAGAALGLVPPTGQISGDWYILNVAQTTTFSGAATAIKAVDAAGNNAKGNYVFWPQLADGAGNVDSYTADPLFRTNSVDAAGVVKNQLIAAAKYDLPDLSTPLLVGGTPTTQAIALTDAVAHSAVSNQYATDSIIKAKTDWVLSMPTRRYSVGANYAADKTTDAAYRVFNTSVVSAKSGKRFFEAGNTKVDADGNICVASVGNVFYDREEREVRNGAVISPGTQRTVSLCGEVSVLSFKDSGTSALGATVARANIEQGVFENGWGTVSFDRVLPVVGSSFIKLTNEGGLANKFSGTYGITWPHRTAD